MKRNFAFDLVRAFAILLIVFFHVTQMTIDSQTVHHYISGAKYGVDIFFCLSGYLVGTLYWREYKQNGSVNLIQFWLRRWSRTLPLYYIFLAVSFAAVYISRKEAFDFSYLFFLQNYRHEMPYFLVSWSLCIEEHFYLFMPLILTLLLVGKNTKVFLYACIGFIFLPMLFRLYEVNNIVGDIPFNYLTTATHLNLDGLFIGLLFSYFAAFVVKIVLPKLRYLLILSFLIVFSSIYINSAVFYVLGFLLMPLLVTASMYSLKNKTFNINERLYKFIEYTSISSYTLYLVHPLIIHFSLVILNKIGIQNPILKFSFTLALAMSLGFFIYHILERKLLIWREKNIPAQVKSKTIVAHERIR